MSNQHTVLLVDKSGSMTSHTKETQDSIKSIIEEMDRKTHFTLVFFDHEEYQIVKDDLIRNINPAVAYLYQARGWTPITDSVYKAIQDIVMKVKEVEELSQPHRIIIFTDGHENSSEYVTAEDCGTAIEHFTENFGWEFKFIGPKSQEQDITRYTNTLKIGKENVVLYASVSEGLEAMKEMAIAE